MLKRIWFISAGFIIVGVAVYLGFSNRYNIHDWIVLNSYDPPAEVVELAETSGMSDHGETLFFVNKPVISPKETFASQCINNEQTIILGCYTGDRIFIYKIDDPKLYGVEEVTGAHEMLHEAYDRLSRSEKSKIDELLEAAYNRLNEPKLQELMASYAISEPGERHNELHSILGTEYRNLGPELENYYTKYFTDRLKVVSLAENYKNVFESIKAQVDKIDSQLTIQKAEIESKEKSVESLGKQILSQKATMENLIATGQTKAYNSQVNSFNSSINRYNSEVASIKVLIADYNKLVEQRNAIAVQQETLAKSLDSRLDPIN